LDRRFVLAGDEDGVGLRSIYLGLFVLGIFLFVFFVFRPLDL
jgi:hypothetical protein